MNEVKRMFYWTTPRRRVCSRPGGHGLAAVPGALFFLGLVAMLGSPLRAQGSGGPPVLQGIPPHELGRTASLERMEVQSNAYLTATARHRLLDKSIHIDYYATESGPRDWPIANKSLVIQTSYYPTAVSFLADDLIAVAGKRSGAAGDDTVVELWSLTVPTVVYSPPSPTGEVDASIRGARVVSQTIVLEVEESGKDMVCAILRLRGKPSSMLVQFWDSRDVYELEFSEALSPTEPPPADPFPMTLVLSATPGSGAPYVSELADHRRVWVRGATHQTAGYVYTWMAAASRQLADAPDGAPALTFFDTDMDGHIDGWGTQTAQQNQAMGLLDQSLYVELGLCQEWK